MKRVTRILLLFLFISGSLILSWSLISWQHWSFSGEVSFLQNSWWFSLLLFVIGSLIIGQLVKLNQTQRDYQGHTETDREFRQLLQALGRTRKKNRKTMLLLTNQLPTFVTNLNKYMSPQKKQQQLTSLTIAVNQLTSLKEQQLEKQKKRLSRRHQHLERHVEKEQVANLSLEQLDKELATTQRAINELKRKQSLKGKLATRNEKELPSLEAALTQWQVMEQPAYNQALSYFDSVYQVFNYLNQQLEHRLINLKDYRHYMTVFRQQLTREERLLVLVYSLVFPRGAELGAELVGTSFFGDLFAIKSTYYLDYPELFFDYLANHCQEGKRPSQSISQRQLARYHVEASRKATLKSFETKRFLVHQLLNDVEPQLTNGLGQNYLEATDYLKGIH